MSKPWLIERMCDCFWTVAFVQEGLTAIHYRYDRKLEGEIDDPTRHEFFSYEVDEILKKTAKARCPNTQIEWRFVFDETAWPPVDDDPEGRRGRRGVLYVKFGYVAEYLVFRIDFDKPLDMGVAMAKAGAKWEFTNIFHVVFG